MPIHHTTLASSLMETTEMLPRNDADHVGFGISTSDSGVTSTTLLDLPPEIILEIADFLPTTSTASFALCNKQLAAYLCRSWNLLSTVESEDRIQFLSILSRDLPCHHACHGCIRLHLSSSIPRPELVRFNTRQPSSCIPASTRRDYIIYNGALPISYYWSPYSLYNLYFTHVQLALKRHRYGLDHGISLSELSHTNIQFVGGKAFLFSIDARIASNELVMRCQEWILSAKHPREELLSGNLHLSVCRHAMTYNARWGLDDRLTILLQCRLGHKATDNGCACMGLQQCPWCPMEYQIDVVDFEEQGLMALCATKWLNLGAGLTTRGSHWWAHGHIPHNLPLGTICSSYESQEELEELSVNNLTAENKKRLSSSLRRIRGRIYISRHGRLQKSIPSFFDQLLASASKTITRFVEVFC